MLAVIDGLRINYEVYGQGERLLLLHGWAVNLHSFETIIPALSQNFQVIALDLPGFGHSEAPKTAFGVYDYANFLEKFLDFLDVKEVNLLGHSMGGGVALAYVLSYKRSRKLILEDSAAIRKKGLAILTKIYIAKTLKLFALPYFRQHLKHILGSTDYKNAGGMRPTLVKLVNEDLSGRLREIAQPTLIVWGQNDKTTTLDEARRLNEGIRGSRLEVMSDCDHFPHLEQPTEFAKIVTGFLVHPYS